LVLAFLAAVAVAVDLVRIDLVVLVDSHREGKVQEVGNLVQGEDTSLVVRHKASRGIHQVPEDHHGPIHQAGGDRMVVGMGAVDVDRREDQEDQEDHVMMDLAVVDLAEDFVIDVVVEVGLELVEDEIRSAKYTWSASYIYQISIKITYKSIIRRKATEISTRFCALGDKV
jgi:hypothetical protein